MSRQLCIQFSNAFYHIFSRGSNKQTIFFDEEDFQKFKKICLAAKQKFNLRFFAYCLMNNHYHLYLSTPDANLAVSMKYINEVYALYFLRKYREKDGHVFRGRYGRKLVQNDRYSKHLIRYIHLNPVAANLVNDASQWKWSSYLAFIEPQCREDLVEYDWSLDQFGNENVQIAEFENFHDNYYEKDEIDFENRSQSYIGDENFPDEICQNLGILNLTKAITKLIKYSPKEFETSLAKINETIHDNSLKYKLQVYFLREIENKSYSEIALLTNKTIKAVSKTNERFMKELKSSENLKDLVRKVI